MVDRNPIVATLTVLLVASAAVPGAAAITNQSTQTDARASAGSHVDFETDGNAVLNYSVDGATVAESVRVQSQSEAREGGGIDVGTDVSAMTGFAGAAISVEARSETSTRMETDSGATISAHDNGHGSLVVAAEGQSQFVGLNVSEEAAVETDGEDRLVVTTPAGAKAAVLVVGNGSVAVTDDGNVSAELAENSQLVVRTYGQERSEADRQQEELITSERAAAAVYLTANGTDVVDYGQNATVDVTGQAEGSVEMTVERSRSQGKVVITSVSEDAFANPAEIQVAVDGEAAVEASTYSELAAAADGGDSSKYMVRSEGDAAASADVLVALNHFSERLVTMTDAGSATDDGSSDGTTATATPMDGDGSAGDDATATPGSSGPGFTVLAAALALAGVAALALRRRS